MKSKPNPRKIPRTQADVEAAINTGRLQGMEFMLYLVLFVLKDKHDAPHEDVIQLGREVDQYCEQINKGEIKLRDVKTALKEEFDLTIKL